MRACSELGRKSGDDVSDAGKNGGATAEGRCAKRHIFAVAADGAARAAK